MKKHDFIIIGVVAIIVIALFVGIKAFNSKDGKYVQVEVDGQTVDTFSLDEEIQKEYCYNEETNVLEIKDGKATMTSASCPDQICVNHKSINKTGESIICLPHKLVVSVISDNADDEIDGVA